MVNVVGGCVDNGGGSDGGGGGGGGWDSGLIAARLYVKCMLVAV